MLRIPPVVIPIPFQGLNNNFDFFFSPIDFIAWLPTEKDHDYEGERRQKSKKERPAPLQN
jgi:hypothetical protein